MIQLLAQAVQRSASEDDKLFWFVLLGASLLLLFFWCFGDSGSGGPPDGIKPSSRGRCPTCGSSTYSG